MPHFSRWRLAPLFVAASICLSSCAAVQPVPSQAPSSPTAQTTAVSTTTPSPSPPEEGDPVASDAPAALVTPGQGSSVTVVDVQLTTWGTEDGVFSAAAVVSGVASNDGTCELTLERGSSRLTATGTPSRSAASTDCAQGLEISVRDVSPGTWRATVTYTAPGLRGTSTATEVTLP